MNRNKLNFEEISQSMEVLDRDSQRGVKGGLTAAELLADIAANGIDKYVGKSFSFDGGQFGYMSNNSSIDSGSIGGGSDYTYNGGMIPEVVITATRINKPPQGSLSNSPTFQAFSNMFAAMDLTASMTTSAAYYGGSQLPLGFIRGAGLLSIVGVADNGYQLYENPNWNDGAQVAVGGTLLAIGWFVSAPVSVPATLIGGAGLFAWELAESHNGW